MPIPLAPPPELLKLRQGPFSQVPSPLIQPPSTTASDPTDMAVPPQPFWTTVLPVVTCPPLGAALLEEDVSVGVGTAVLRGASVAELVGEGLGDAVLSCCPA